MLWLILLLPLLYIVIGFVLTEKNAPTLMSGYNTLSAEEQAAYPLQESVRFFRRFHWAMGSLTLLVGLVLWSLGYFDLAVNAVVLLPLVAYIYFIYRSMRFAAKSQRGVMKFAFVMLLAVTVGVGFLFVYGSQPNTLEVRDSVIIINGMYGLTLAKEQIADIQLSSTLPPIRFKSNGFATAEMRKGFFRSKDGRTLRLFLSRDKTAPMLFIQVKEGKDIYYQSPEGDEDAIYEKLKNWLNR